MTEKNNVNAPKPREVIQKMAAYRPPLEGRRGLLRLDFNERTEGAPIEAIQALASITPDDLATYPEYSPYIKVLSESLGVGEDCVLPTNATDEAIQVVMLTYLDAGDKVLLASPTFSMFAIYAQISGAEVVEVPYNPETLEFPSELYLEALQDPSIKLAVAVDPNNPTATSVDPAVLRKICETRPDIPVLVDEAYGSFTGRTAIPMTETYSNLIVCQTFSKAFGLAGLRIGHLVSCPENIANLSKVRSPYSVNLAAMAAAEALIKAGAEKIPGTFVAKAMKGREMLVRGLEERGFPIRSVGANFVLTHVGSEHKALCQALRDRGILVRDRSSDRGLDGCVRVSAGSSEQMEQFFSTLDAIFSTRALLLDMDGTMVDVSRSYVSCDCKVATEFLEKAGIQATVTEEDVQRLKAGGEGTNDDWVLTARLIQTKAKEHGQELQIPVSDIIPVYQKYYHEEFAKTEEWIMPATLLKRLAKRYRLGIVTGRPRDEALAALAYKGADPSLFEVVITRDEVEPKLKPDPAGLLLALEQMGCGAKGSLYVGDSADDMRAARAAGVHAVGVIAPGDQPEMAREGLLQAGAQEIIEQIMELEGLLL